MEQKKKLASLINAAVHNSAVGTLSAALDAAARFEKLAEHAQKRLGRSFTRQYGIDVGDVSGVHLLDERDMPPAGGDDPGTPLAEVRRVHHLETLLRSLVKSAGDLVRNIHETNIGNGDNAKLEEFLSLDHDVVTMCDGAVEEAQKFLQERPPLQSLDAPDVIDGHRTPWRWDLVMMGERTLCGASVIDADDAVVVSTGVVDVSLTDDFIDTMDMICKRANEKGGHADVQVRPDGLNTTTPADDRRTAKMMLDRHGKDLTPLQRADLAKVALGYRGDAIVELTEKLNAANIAQHKAEKETERLHNRVRFLETEITDAARAWERENHVGDIIQRLVDVIEGRVVPGTPRGEPRPAVDDAARVISLLADNTRYRNLYVDEKNAHAATRHTLRAVEHQRDNAIASLATAVAEEAQVAAQPMAALNAAQMGLGSAFPWKLESPMNSRTILVGADGDVIPRDDFELVKITCFTWRVQLAEGARLEKP